jgi:S-DNA-T family DNA segregation ATPase FtsK/SpoIIIE
MPAPHSLSHDTLVLPRHAPAPARGSFPVLAVLAPLAGAAVLYAVIGSPMMLAFAALSPVIAIAGTIDGRIAARRRRTADARAYALESARFLDAVEAVHDRERAALDLQHPRAAALLEDASHRPRRWVASRDRLSPVRVGTGDAVSAVAVSGSPESDEDRRLAETAGRLARAPVLADAAAGIGVIGASPTVRAVVRGLVVQLAHAHAPGTLVVTAPDGEEYRWLDPYPHAVDSHHAPLRVQLLDAQPGQPPAQTTPPRATALAPAAPVPAVIAVAPAVDALPAGCRLVVRAEADGTLQLLSTPGEPPLRAELITAQQAAAFGRALAATAAAKGVAPPVPLPQRVGFTELEKIAGDRQGSGVEGSAEAIADGREPSGLPATFSVAGAGALTIDLVESGPHAVVTGTTGSGKSELLISWVLGMAARSSPRSVNFLLVDFKGGTAFRRLATLPHTVGVVTDLGHGEALRALKSLRAELRRREAELARVRASDVRDAGGALARLVIVVDEAAAMLAAFPDLAALFVDIAARGRALGVHLILGTQRATGVLSDALIANCALRVSLRLASDSDSVALLGTDAAARLPHGIPGRLVVSRHGATVVAQAATVAPGDIEVVAARHAGSGRSRAPWLPALPETIPLAAFGTPARGAVVLGARDDPDRQAQHGVVYRPQDAHLLVLGTRGSGKTAVLDAIRAQWNGDVIAVPADVEGGWDALEAAASRSAARSAAEAPCLVVLDDVDALLHRFDDAPRDAAIERVRTVLVDGPRASTGLVSAAATLPSGLRGVAGRFGERLLLRQPDRQQHVLAGAPAELYDPDAPPGRGVWRDHTFQAVLAGAPPLPEPTTPPPLDFAPGSVTVVVTPSPRVMAERITASCPQVEVTDIGAAGALQASGEPGNDLSISSSSAPRVLVGDADAWQARFALLTLVRQQAVMVFDGCSLAQLRAILQTRVLPPVTLPQHVIVREPNGVFRRARLP